MNKIFLLYIFTLFQCHCLEYKGIDVTIYKGVSYVSFILMWLYTVSLKNKRSLYNQDEVKIEKKLHIVAFGILFSILPAFFIEGQSLATSIMTTIGLVFPFFSYDFIQRLKINSIEIEKLIIVFGFLFVFIVTINITTFPDMIFGSGEMDNERGGIRIRSNMIMFGVLAFFFYINEYLCKKKALYLLLAFVMFVAVSASLFRVYIILMLVLSTIMILRYSTSQRRIWSIIVILILVFAIIPQTTTYKNLVELSEAQKEISDNRKEDVRIEAYRYFLFESQTGIVSVLFGHGIASIGHSEYGKRVENFQNNTGVYQSDVGWVGSFHDFGLITVFAFASLLIFCMKKKKLKQSSYLFYFYAFFFLGGFTNILLHSPVILLPLILSFYVLNHKDEEFLRSANGFDNDRRLINKRL